MTHRSGQLRRLLRCAFRGYSGRISPVRNQAPRSPGEIGPGDVQWMTAGAGILHEEFHSEAYARSGGGLRWCSCG